ncbi:CLUMA_CG000165, isoform A [Clunio marinus]|uniref:Ubiquitin carboxyl-terminal hydrolase n=1 Tax=Clunio marinus TaxID=568069 RepID=A0A1J1HIJ0_9DIPT|nr:CLUMA_CG000165, isoform A [Clunio marinus]
MSSNELEKMETEETPDITPSDQNMEDELRSEATFQLTIENFSKLSETILSDAHYVRGLPWKIMAMPRSANDKDKSLGFFLQCNAECDSNWNCSATADLRMLSFKKDVAPVSRKIKHIFYNKENDWGFSTFQSFSDILDPEKGYIQNDTVILEVHVQAEAPHNAYWDSKKLTGYVGLKNQGATCYMNSLLQTLYFTNELRKEVYKMPTEADDSSKSVALALQRVFHDLQFSNKPVGTKKLTKSFGWETLDSFMQHDVQEFLRVLLDKLEIKMKGTSIEGTIPRLFAGKMISYIKCKNVSYKSTKMETFYDIQLNIKGKKNVAESFDDYISTEILDDENKYDAGEYGLQKAEKGVIFSSFPPILHLHLLRFQYDPMTNNSVKFNDRFEFNEKINLDKYLEKPEDTPANYILHAVLVHSGDNHGGHYVVFINPRGDGNWCKFDDDVVSAVPKAAAIDQNYGGTEDDFMLNVRNCTNAYMLVYVRESAMKTILQEVTEEDIPSELNEKLNEEKRMEAAKRKERNEASNYINVNVILEDYFECHHAGDLFNAESAHYRSFKVKQNSTLLDLVTLIQTTFKVPLTKMRIWSFTPIGHGSGSLYHHNSSNQNLTSNGLTMVDFSDQELMQHPITYFSRDHNPWVVYLELMPPDIDAATFPPFSPNANQLLFFKYYDPVNKSLTYAGSRIVANDEKLSDLTPELNKFIGTPTDTALDFYKYKGKVEPHSPIGSFVKNGEILIFERSEKIVNLELPTYIDYFNDLQYRVDVTFIDKNIQNDNGFTIELSYNSNYDQMAKAVVKTLLDEAAKVIKFSDNSSRKLRICEQHNSKLIWPSPIDTTSLDKLQIYCEAASQNTSQKFLRIEEIPVDEIDLDEQIETLVPVLHYHKNLFTTFGTPLLIKVCDQETFKDVKNRIQKKLNISQYEWEKYKLAIIQNKTVNPVDDNDKVVLEKFQIAEEGQRCILGLDHTNKNAYPTSKLNIFEKSIKIYN